MKLEQALELLRTDLRNSERDLKISSDGYAIKYFKGIYDATKNHISLFERVENPEKD